MSRLGKSSQVDIELLKRRVRAKKHPALKEAGLYIVCKREDCARINNEFINSLPGELITIKAIHHNATQKMYKPYIDPKDGAVASTSFIYKLQLKLDSKVMIIHNVNTSD